MIGMESDYFGVLKESLTGEREVDQHTHISIAVLSDRLERVKKLGKAFSGICFSDSVKQLSRESSALAVK
jgi:hypothetical protein